MRWAIGFWIMGLALVYLLVFIFNSEFGFKDKMKTLLQYMTFLTLLIVGACVMTWGM